MTDDRRFFAAICVYVLSGGDENEGHRARVFASLSVNMNDVWYFGGQNVQQGVCGGAAGPMNVKGAGLPPSRRKPLVPSTTR
jgi:hypothetical protein